MPIIPNYLTETLDYLTEEEAKRLNWRPMRKNFLEFQDLKKKYARFFEQDIASEVVRLFEREFCGCYEIKEKLGAEGFNIPKLIISAILKDQSEVFREYGWRLSRNKAAVNFFIENSKKLGESDAVLKTIRRYAITRPTLINLLKSFKIDFNFASKKDDFD